MSRVDLSNGRQVIVLDAAPSLQYAPFVFEAKPYIIDACRAYGIADPDVHGRFGRGDGDVQGGGRGWGTK